MTVGYTKTTWVHGAAPGIDADKLNNLEGQYDAALADAADDVDADIATHAALTATHGAADIADKSDIAVDANLSAAAQAAIAASHARLHALNSALDHGTLAAGAIIIGGAADAITILTKGSAHQRLVMDSSAAYPSWQDEIIMLGMIIGNGIDVIGTGLKGAIPMFVGMDITEWSIVADVSGSITLDLWVDSEANWPPTIADTIVASDKPKIVTATKANGTALTGWTKAFASGTKRYMYINVDSCTSIKRVTFVLTAKKRL